MDDLDEMNAYSKKAEENAALSEAYIKMMMARGEAENNIKLAKNQIAYAEKIDAPNTFPMAYTSAKDNLEKAESAFDGEDWEQANAYAKASLAALDGIREVTPLPEFYIVKPWAETRDCYWNISGRPYVYNNPLLWENLYQANKSSMPKPEDPNLIHPGMKMKIPSLTGEYRKGTYDPKKEYQTLQKEKNTNVEVKLVNNDIRHWKGRIKGPIDTCYQGGIFDVDIIIPDDYPFKPPKMKFDTKIWHPNISSVTGAICLDILKNEWTPALTIRTALISLQALMCEPVPNDPQDAVVAKQYMSDIKLFNQTAKHWVEEYANPERNFQKKIKEITEMGFTEEQAKEALEKNDQDVEKAINFLVGG